MRILAMAVALGLLAVSCEKQEAPEVAKLASVTRATPQPPPDPAGGPRAEFNQTGQRVEIRWTGGTLVGEPRESGKRKYRLGSGAISHEVKPNENGFKLRRADGSLLWKVKITADKIKVSDNEENANPFELKRRENGEVKVVAPGEREIGRTRSAAEGVLLIDAIPELERHILYGELMARKQ